MRKVLVIDDDETSLKLVSLYLSRAGYAVDTSKDSVEALRSLGERRPDLIISDISMPGLDGYGLLSALRAQPSTASIPLIFVTAYADHQGFRKSMKLGADDYLTKPVSRRELLDAVAARLARADAASGGPPPEVIEAPPEEPSAFTRLTDYSLVRKIAEGGMSSIYLADQKSTGRRLVLKMIPLKKGIAQDEIDRFVQEHALLDRLQHRNIVQIYAQGFNDEHLYIAMEYFPNGSLAEALRGPLPEKQCFDYAGQIARGLEAAHRAGIVHRDLKPDNVMIREDGSLALTDFGIAKDLNRASNMTQHGMVLGTPSYVAPEQASGLPVGPAADVYSLGVMLFQMLTGRKPYQAGDPMDILQQHLHSPVPRLPEEMAQWQDLINFMMAKSPQARPGDASAVLACFRALGVE